MPQTEALRSTLKDLMKAIESGDGDGLRLHLATLDSLRDTLNEDAPPGLLHCLEKRSYAKAIDLLEGTDEATTSGVPPQSNC
ncbi:MAG: hypothetical protein QF689_11040 [Candidatus Latescibacteria bacterium]|jgi:hypothetical protein|nr:hypothetical protein [Gemmatimonadaceae bacterium]MDP7449112.1 hypothetical protein [Candidatus Latescibacterota bacterium]HJP28973.1 hypothetical protein [Candidatus Latescibacterota bacterium]|tara:strand:- start:295 stop:540 length:246 start_codon:yes stop_codon:yes gene_type:complete